MKKILTVFVVLFLASAIYAEYSGGGACPGAAGMGDMLKSVYDIDADNLVDNSDELDGQDGNYYAPMSSMNVIDTNFDNIMSSFNAIDANFAPINAPAFTGGITVTGDIYQSTYTAGKIYSLDRGSVTVITTANVFEVISGTSVLASHAGWFDMPQQGRLRYVGAQTKRFKLEASISGSTVANAKRFDFTLHKNGASCLTCTSRSYFANSTQFDEISIIGIFELAQNDYIEIQVTNIADTNDYLGDTYSLIAIPLN